MTVLLFLATPVLASAASFGSGSFTNDLSGAPKSFSQASMGALEPTSAIPSAPTNLRILVVN